MEAAGLPHVITRIFKHDISILSSRYVTVLSFSSYFILGSRECFNDI
jgi:hypothetical protein